MYSFEYIAGFFDGEGCVAVYHNSNTNGYSLRTQLTQNKSDASMKLFKYLKSTWGGNLGEHQTLSKKTGLNWQANGDVACSFLKDIEPHLNMKQPQARIAIEWHEGRPLPLRDERGRILPRSQEELDKAIKVYDLLREMKKEF